MELFKQGPVTSKAAELFFEGDEGVGPDDVDGVESELLTLASVSGSGGESPWRPRHPWDYGEVIREDVVAKLENALVSRRRGGATSSFRYYDLPWFQDPGKPKPRVNHIQRLDLTILSLARELLEINLKNYELMLGAINAPNPAPMMKINTGSRKHGFTKKNFTKKQLLAAIRTAKALISIIKVFESDPPNNLPDSETSVALAGLAQIQNAKNEHMVPMGR